MKSNHQITFAESCQERLYYSATGCFPGMLSFRAYIHTDSQLRFEVTSFGSLLLSHNFALSPIPCEECMPNQKNVSIGGYSFDESLLSWHCYLWNMQLFQSWNLIYTERRIFCASCTCWNPFFQSCSVLIRPWMTFKSDLAYNKKEQRKTHTIAWTILFFAFLIKSFLMFNIM